MAAVRESPNEVAVSASWNGATSVATWEVLAGEGPGSLSPVATAPWSGFETKISVPSTDSTFEVQGAGQQRGGPRDLRPGERSLTGTGAAGRRAAQPPAGAPRSPLGPRPRTATRAIVVSDW